MPRNSTEHSPQVITAPAIPTLVHGVAKGAKVRIDVVNSANVRLKGHPDAPAKSLEDFHIELPTNTSLLKNVVVGSMGRGSEISVNINGSANLIFDLENSTNETAGSAGRNASVDHLALASLRDVVTVEVPEGNASLCLRVDSSQSAQVLLREELEDSLRQGGGA
eukprot:Cvel_34340.t1-p1 / transcript=Cvel_34340.t1 / gene=Cvel_34340 / organism=Chromera_velia_CCMP2878 / gene_product=hypothetical protein / transcript_product=hypothetical protein / location=Cvel_scaffold5862:3039-3531(+) / protein_length=164 / sequence_SO=supercontig / SO=protein_coding / is_pseudo=false